MGRTGERPEGTEPVPDEHTAKAGKGAQTQVEDFLASVSGGSPETDRAYRGVLKRYGEWNNGVAITRAKYDRFILSMKGAKLKANTIALYSTVLRAYAGYCGVSTKKWQTPKNFEPQVEPLKPNEIRMLLDACGTFRRSGETRRFIILFLIGTGLRVSEFVNLSWSDLDLERGMAYVRTGKGNKGRTIRLSKTAWDAASAYFCYTHPTTSIVYASGMPTRVAPVTTSNQIRWLVKTTAQKAGLGMRNIHPHLFRHSFAVATTVSRVLTQRSLQMHLGHSSPVTTARYQKYSVVSEESDLAKADLTK